MTPIPAVPKEWQHFAASLAFAIALPLVPLAIEAWLKGTITCQSLTLGTAIYAVSVGVSSKNVMMLAATFLASIVFAVAFGVVIGGGSSEPRGCTSAAYISIAMISLIHAGERFNKHVANKEPFLLL